MITFKKLDRSPGARWCHPENPVHLEKVLARFIAEENAPLRTAASCIPKNHCQASPGNSRKARLSFRAGRSLQPFGGWRQAESFAAERTARPAFPLIARTAPRELFRCQLPRPALFRGPRMGSGACSRGHSPRGRSKRWRHSIANCAKAP